MRKMKDSRIPWIGLIPQHWEMVRVKNIFNNHKNIVGEKESEFERLALTLNGVIKRDKNDSKGLQSENLSTYQILNEKELVFKMIDLANVNTSRVGYSPYTGIVSPVYIILNNDDYSKYGYYYFYSMWQREIFNNLGNDGVRSALNASDMMNLPFPNISVQEAKTIANFLDEKIQEIDNAIEKTKKTIEDYKKLRKTIINKAVTKGIDNDIEMVDSGIKWIGNIPKGWKKSKFKYCTDIIMGQSPSGDDIKLEGQTLFMQGNKEFGEIFPHPTTYCETCNKYSRVGDILMSVRAPVGAINESDKIYGIGRGLCSIKVNKNIDKHFFKYFLEKSIDDMSYYSNGSVFDAITTEVLNNFYIFEPSTNEQIRIVEYLNNKCGEINKLIESKEKIVEELESYKKSVIYEYVTGKKEVK